MNVYLYDKTFDGLLTAVFDAYFRKTFPDALLSEGDSLAVCERAYIVSQGHLIAHGTPTEILQDEHVKRVYLGEDFRL